MNWRQSSCPNHLARPPVQMWFLQGTGFVGRPVGEYKKVEWQYAYLRSRRNVLAPYTPTIAMAAT